MTRMSADEATETRKEFRRLVNMPKAALRKWLASKESQSVGMTHGGEKVAGGGGPEAVGHEMGRHILEIQQKKATELTDEDHHAMRKVVGYIHRHLKQRPSGDVGDTRWRKSLMNWGYDPEV